MWWCWWWRREIVKMIDETKAKAPATSHANHRLRPSSNAGTCRWLSGHRTNAAVGKIEAQLRFLTVGKLGAELVIGSLVVRDLMLRCAPPRTTWADITRFSG